jgi:hypothetical protein
MERNAREKASKDSGNEEDGRKVSYRRLETEGGVAIGTVATPDNAGVEKLKTFYEAMAISDRVGIEFGENTTVIYRDAYAYLNQNKMEFCERNCDDLFFSEASMVAGAYNPKTNQIVLYRTAVEPWYTAGECQIASSTGEIAVEIWNKKLTNSGLESAIWALGHEAAHSRGIDMTKGTGANFHRNAEIAGQRALDSYRYIVRSRQK